MRYAFEDQLIAVVGAADSLIEFEDFIRETDSTVVAPETLGVKSAELVTLMDLLSDDRFQGFKKAPVMIVHSSDAERDAFNERFHIVCMKRNAVINRHEDMLHAELADPYSANYEDPRSIEEIHDLDEEDRWDRRSDEERAQDEAYKKAFKDAQKKGEISGDSFGPNPDRPKKKKKKTDPKVFVTDIDMHEDSDGDVEVDRVLAVKGLHDARPGEGTKAERIAAPHDPEHDATLAKTDAAMKAAAAAQTGPIIEEADSDNLEIDINGMVAIYHKVEVTGAKLADIRPALEAEDIDLERSAIVQRNSPTGCWFVFLRQLQAEEAMTVLTKASFTVETYAVNDAGERLVPKGVQVVDELKEDEQLPRPWNFRAKEIRKMSAEEKRKNVKSMKPEEFIFVGNYEGAVHGTVIYITPRSYFREHGKMWDKSLDIAHILPMDIKEVTPGVYRTKSRDWNSASYSLNSQGFKENLLLQIHLNLT